MNLLLFFLLQQGIPKDDPVAFRPNILVILVDDIGREHLGFTGEGNFPAPPTPAIDSLVAQGVRFSNFYVPPVCSSSRANFLTGRRSWRHGIGKHIGINVEVGGLWYSETTVPELLGPAGYSTAWIGKWHLRGLDALPVDPVAHGFDVFAGTHGNINDYYSYTYWAADKNGAMQVSTETTYATAKTTEDLLWAMATLPEPWFIVGSYHVGHIPYHWPPSGTFVGPYPQTNRGQFDAMLEAFDGSLGSVVSGCDLDDTTVLFVSDNGSADQVADNPPAKATTREGGINVPLLVSGYRVGLPGTSSAQLINMVDLFSAVLDVAEVSPPPSLVVDGMSFRNALIGQPAPRTWTWCEWFNPNVFGGAPSYQQHHRTVYDGRFKLKIRPNGVEQFHDLSLAGPGLEGANLLLSPPLGVTEQAAYDDLRAKLLGVF